MDLEELICQNQGLKNQNRAPNTTGDRKVYAPKEARRTRPLNCRKIAAFAAIPRQFRRAARAASGHILSLGPPFL